MHRVEYRTATRSDAEAIAALHARSWRENYRGSYSDAYLDGDVSEDRLRVWRDRLDRPPGNQLVEVAVEVGELVGFVCAYGAHDPERGSLIDNLHVARAVQRGGIGSELLRRAGAWLALRYPEAPVHLTVLEVNASARRFYERAGGRDSGETTVETPGGAMVRCRRYVWPRPAALATVDPPRPGGVEDPEQPVDRHRVASRGGPGHGPA